LLGGCGGGGGKRFFFFLLYHEIMASHLEFSTSESIMGWRFGKQRRFFSPFLLWTHAHASHPAKKDEGAVGFQYHEILFSKSQSSTVLVQVLVSPGNLVHEMFHRPELELVYRVKKEGALKAPHRHTYTAFMLFLVFFLHICETV